MTAQGKTAEELLAEIEARVIPTIAPTFRFGPEQVEETLEGRISRVDLDTMIRLFWSTRSEARAAARRQAEAFAWALDMFGPIAANLDERALRLAEEAVEFAQAEHVSKEVMLRLVERVYSRPAGDPIAEIGAVALTLELAAEGRGLSAIECADNEFRRVKSKTREHFAERHAAKAAEGIAKLSPIG